MKAKKKYKGQLVFQYVDKISRKLLERYRQVIRDIARGKHGIYALYKDERIYYVGLASNLRQRLGHHLRDRHKKTWNRFSIYLTTSSENLKDLESLFLRIFKPKGNTKVGKFLKAKNLKRTVNSRIRELQRIERKSLMGEDFELALSNMKHKKKQQVKKGHGTLAPYATKRFHIRFQYKGKLYIANVMKSGYITFDVRSADYNKFKGQKYKSPSAAGQAVTGRSCDGWLLWKYRNTKGEWVPLDELRGGKIIKKLKK